MKTNENTFYVTPDQKTEFEKSPTKIGNAF